MKPVHVAPLLLLSTLAAHAMGGSFDITLVDAPPQFSQMTPRSSLVDGNGRMHVAYGGDHLYYATDASGSWVVTTVDPASDAGEEAALAMDADGRIHISYFDLHDNDAALKYATNASGNWVVSTVDPDAGPTGIVGHKTGIAVDAYGKVHVAYVDTDD
jgi:hypothetical protein